MISTSIILAIIIKIIISSNITITKIYDCIVFDRLHFKWNYPSVYNERNTVTHPEIKSQWKIIKYRYSGFLVTAVLPMSVRVLLSKM